MPVVPVVNNLLRSLVSRPVRMLADLAVFDHPNRNRMPLEAELAQGWFQVRADIPGIDPTRDVEITADVSELLIRAERSQRTAGRSEFRYGSFVRSVPLPDGANPVDITTTYAQGILNIWVPLSGPASAIGKPVRLPVTY